MDSTNSDERVNDLTSQQENDLRKDLQLFPSLSLPTSPTASVKRLFLCRHGETAYNAMGILQGSRVNQSLNERGKYQASLLANQLKSVPIDLIVVSQLKRARETAQHIQEYHPNVPFLEINELEEISWGDWDGSSSPAAINELISSWSEGDFAARSPNGESPFEVERRAVPALYKLILERPEANICFVLHGRLLRIILSSLIFQSLAHMHHFTHHNTCINLIDVEIETNPEKAKIGARTIPDPQSVFMKATLPERLDDNVELSNYSLSSPVILKPVLSLAKQTTSSPPTAVSHPNYVNFIPILLDDCRHLPPEYL